MKPRLHIPFLIVSLWLYSALAFAGVEQISEKEFRDLAAELSAKVNLFQAGWEQDPKAEFYGGTTRDYLYWLKGQFVNTHSRSQAEAEIAKLRALPVIDVRDFIIGDSDVDIITAQKGTLNADDFGVRKIDSQSVDILDPTTDAGKNEILQGYIPAEKIRLGKDGFHASAANLGNGVQEIYQGKLSVHFASAEDFAKSKYAQEGINHPVLLALRYLRLQAINYYRTHGKDFPDFAKLHAGMDEESAAAVRKVIDQVNRSEELRPYLEKSKFKSWINGAIQKSFRSYTNPTAALELMKEFGVDQLPPHFQEIEPLNKYVFSQFRDQAEINAALKKYGVDEKSFYSPPSTYFPDGKLYHGTRTEDAFRGIIYQGILPSESGAGGPGLYGVAAEHKEFSEQWGGDRDRLLSFEVSPEAKIVDITKGEGQRIWEKFGQTRADYEKFAQLFGVDLIRYPYDPQAFVVKNSAVLSPAQGVNRSIRPLSQIIEEARGVKDVKQILRMLSVNNLSLPEKTLIWNISAVSEETVTAFLKKKNVSLADAIELFKTPRFAGNEGLHGVMDNFFHDLTKQKKIIPVLEEARLPGQIEFIDGLFRQPESIGGERMNLLRKLSENPPFPPYATEFVLSELEKNNRDFLSVYFLTKSNLTSSQAKRLGKIFDNLIPESRAAVAIQLVKHGVREAHVKKHLITTITADWVDERTAAQILEAFHELYPHDPDAIAAVKDYYLQHFNHIAKNSTVSHEAVMRFVSQDSEVKKYILEHLSNGSYNHVNALSLMELTDAEAARCIMAVASGSNDVPVMEFIKGRQLGPKSTKALLEAYFPRQSESAREKIVAMLKLQPDKASLQAYAREAYEKQIAEYANDPSLTATQAYYKKLFEELKPAFEPIAPIGCADGFAALTK